MLGQLRHRRLHHVMARDRRLQAWVVVDCGNDRNHPTSCCGPMMVMTAMMTDHTNHASTDEVGHMTDLAMLAEQTEWFQAAAAVWMISEAEHDWPAIHTGE